MGGMETEERPANWDYSHYNGELTIVDIAIRCGSEADAWDLLEEMRWGKDRERVACSHCGCTDVHYIVPENGTTRKSASGNMSARRVWKCHKRGGGCGRQFTATVGTVMHRSKTSVQIWLFVMFEMMASKNGVAAREIQRKYKVSGKTAWHMLHRIREAMGLDAHAEPMRGTVMADETFHGGKASKMNKKRREAVEAEHGPIANLATKGKTAVLTMIEEGGEARSRVINDVTGSTLSKHIENSVVLEDTDLVTDERAGYRTIGEQARSHTAVDHSIRQYRKNGRSSNAVESYFSQLKRSLDGTHHHCSSVHLGRYLAEFDYRHTTRHINDSERMRDLVTRDAFNRPLPYNKLIGRDK